MTMTEQEIRDLAKYVAKKTRKHVSFVEVPYTKETWSSVKQRVPIQKGWFIFAHTEYVEKEVPIHESRVVFERKHIDGWILRTFYENCDEICYAQGRITYRKLSVDKTYYVLKKNGDLSVFQIGYNIESYKTTAEKVKIWRELQEKPIVFPADWDAHIGSAYALDLKPIKWEHKVKKSYNHDEVQYFRRNIPNSYGTCESKGESYAIYKQGEGIELALRRLLPEEPATQQCKRRAIK